MSGALISVFANQRGFVTVPGAPTIGTATQTGSTTATVTYTAPASNGGSPITLYTATSSPGGVTGTLATSGSGTITVSGLTGNTAYTFTVKATNSVGESVASAASNSITTLPSIGQAYGGGFFAGQISTAGNGIADYNLVVGPKSSAENASKQWKVVNTTTTGTTSFINGPANSAAMNDVTHPAAQFCEAVTAGSQTDWYLPAKNEIDVCYFNLKPTTTSNGTFTGTNANSVPTRTTNFTAGTPAQTSATDFRSTGTENFAVDFYWTSTEDAPTAAWYKYFNNGGNYVYSKTDLHRVRAIRRVAV
jgi:hypothetical protein